MTQQATMTAIINFPNYHLQSDWHEASPQEKIWLRSEHLTNGSNLGKNYDLKILNESNIQVEKNDEDFSIQNYSNRCLVIEDRKTAVKHRFLAPMKQFISVHQEKSVNCLDVAPTGIAVSAGSDGTMKVWDTCSNQIKCELKGHLADVNKCRFFPSNEVILSAGSDMLIKIWSALDGSCPVTLKGHKAAVADLAIVDRGRNIISVGRDGLAKLWSCAKQTCIENLFDNSGMDGKPQINSCALASFTKEFNLGQRFSPRPEECVGTENKVLLLAMESGYVYGVGVDSCQTLFTVNCGSPVNCVTFTNDHNFACGTENGDLYEYDMRNNKQPIRHWLLSKSSILDCVVVRRLSGSGQPGLMYDGLIAGRRDGSVDFLYLHQRNKFDNQHNNQQDDQTIVHLTGSNCDAIYQLVFDDKFVYTCCRDGRVRKYFIPNAFFY